MLSYSAETSNENFFSLVVFYYMYILQKGRVNRMKWKRKGKQVFAMMLAVATLLSGCAPNGIVFRWGYTCDYTQQGGAGNPFFMRFLSTVLGSSSVYRFFNAAESHKMWGSAVFCVSKILQTDVDSINVLQLFRFWRLPIFTGRCLWNVFFQNAGQNHQPTAEAYVLVPALHGIGQIPIDKNPGGLLYR